MANSPNISPVETPPEAPAATPGKAAPKPPKEFTVDQLARAAKTTVRNVRAYQDRGLLEPPERRGRAGVYTENHLSRLRIINDLLARGYTLASIGELFQALESGHDIAKLMGLETALTSPWTDEQPQTYSLLEISKLFGNTFNPVWLARAVEMGILQMDGTRFRAPSPRLLQAGSQLAKAGIPLSDLLEVVRQLRANVEAAAESMVRLVEKNVFDRYGKGLPPADKMPELADIVWRFRPLVEMAVNSEVARAMEIAANKHLGDRLSLLLEQMKNRGQPR